MGDRVAGTGRVEAVEGDITTQQVDAIVNAANSSLLGGGGVDGAIHAAAGPSLLAECRALRRDRYAAGLPVGAAVSTGAGDLPCRWVVHTVGPNHHAGQTDPALLESCFRESLAAAARIGARSIAFPAISAGVFGWAPDQVAEVAVSTICGARAAGVVSTSAGDVDVSGIELVRFVLFGPRVSRAFDGALDAWSRG